MAQDLPDEAQQHIIDAYQNPNDPVNQQIIQGYQSSISPSQDNGTSKVIPAQFNPIDPSKLNIQPQDETDASKMTATSPQDSGGGQFFADKVSNAANAAGGVASGYATAMNSTTS